MGDPQLRSKQDHVNPSGLLKGYKRMAISLMKSLAKATAHPVLEISWKFPGSVCGQCRARFTGNTAGTRSNPYRLTPPYLAPCTEPGEQHPRGKRGKRLTAYRGFMPSSFS